MNKKTIAIIAVIIIAIIGIGLFTLYYSDFTLEGKYAKVTVPSKYALGTDGIASADDVKIMFIGSVKGNDDNIEQFYATVAKNGSASGYKDYKNTTIGNFTAYEFTANPQELKNISSEKSTTGDSSTWIEFSPDIATKGITKNSDIVNMRRVTYINPNNNTINDLIIFTNNPNVDLHSAEFEKIVQSIDVLEKK